MHNVQRRKEERREKKRKLNTKEKRTNEPREGITRHESRSPRPIKQRTTKRSKQLVFQTLHILKCPPIMCPLYTPHQTHETKFQMSNECFPNQFYQPKRISNTVLGKTHKTPKDLKTKHHNWWAFSQWSSKWSIVSPQQRHMTHQSTKAIALLLKLSPWVSYPKLWSKKNTTEKLIEGP